MPAEGRALTRVNWLLRQLNDAPDNLRIDLYTRMARTSTSELLKTVRANPAVLLVDPKADVVRYELTATSQLGTKRGAGRGSYVESVLLAIDGFYRGVLQDLRPWVPKPAPYPKSGSAVTDAGIDTTTVGEDETITIDIDIDEPETQPTETINLDPQVIDWESEEERLDTNETDHVLTPD